MTESALLNEMGIVAPATREEALALAGSVAQRSPVSRVEVLECAELAARRFWPGDGDKSLAYLRELASGAVAGER